MLLTISCVIHDFLASLSTFQPNLSQYIAHISSYCSAALPHSHFHIRLHWVFLLDYIEPSVIQHITSPNTILALPFGILWFCLVQTFPTSKLCSQSVCSRKCLHILHNVSESMFHKYTVQTMSMSILISWCLPGVQSSLIFFFKPRAGDNSAHTDGGT